MNCSVALSCLPPRDLSQVSRLSLDLTHLGSPVFLFLLRIAPIENVDLLPNRSGLFLFQQQTIDVSCFHIQEPVFLEGRIQRIEGKNLSYTSIGDKPFEQSPHLSVVPVIQVIRAIVPSIAQN
jgi:hypothetical protein